MTKLLTVAAWVMAAACVIVAGLLWAENTEIAIGALPTPASRVQCTDDTYEEDDSLDFAQVLDLGSSQVHRHCDEDWLYFQSVPGATYTIETSNLLGGADTILALFTSGGVLLASDDNGGVGSASLIVWTNAAHPLAYVRVTESGSDYQDGQQYTIQVDCTADCPCVDDAFEEDDVASEATVIFPDLGSGQVHSLCDPDWFLFAAASGATYEIRTSNLQGGADTVLSLNGSGGEVASDDNGGGGLASLIQWTADEPEYLVRVTEYADAYANGKTYALSVDCVAACPCPDDLYEDDDYESQANQIFPDLASGQVHSHCDPDWVWFDAASGATYRIETSNLVGGADTVLRLFDSFGSVASDDNSGSGLASLIIWTASEPFYSVEVTEFSDDYQPGEGYTLTLDCVADCPCTDDAYEEDDYASDAKEIFPNSGSAQVHEHCDPDWVFFSPELGATYRIETSNLVGGADTVLDLYGSGGWITNDDDSGSGLASLIVWTASELECSIRVTEHADNYQDGKSYHLQVDCVADCPCVDDVYEDDDVAEQATILGIDQGPKAHHHCDEDWHRFNAAVGATYRIQTSNLGGGADTVISLYDSQGLVASDDNSGVGLASLVDFTATESSWHRIQIGEYGDLYQDGKTYDVEVSCLLDCPPAAIFENGFETGDLIGWSSSAGG